MNKNKYRIIFFCEMPHDPQIEDEWNASWQELSS